MDEQNTQPASPTGDTTESMTEAQAPVAAGEGNGATPVALGSSSVSATDNGQDAPASAEEPAATQEPDVVTAGQAAASPEPAAVTAAEEPAASAEPDVVTAAEEPA